MPIGPVSPSPSNNPIALLQKSSKKFRSSLLNSKMRTLCWWASRPRLSPKRHAGKR